MHTLTLTLTGFCLNPHLSSPIIEIITPSEKALAIFIRISLRNVRYRAWGVQTLSLTLNLTLFTPSAAYACSTL
jgi:hypothetical protein